MIYEIEIKDLDKVLNGSRKTLLSRLKIDAKDKNDAIDKASSFAQEHFKQHKRFIEVRLISSL